MHIFSLYYLEIYGDSVKLDVEQHVFSMKCTFSIQYLLFKMGKHNEFGKEGEQIAIDFLIKKGYTIRHKNYRYLKSEIDIIAQKKEILAIVEVRARSNDQIISIAETITPKKIRLLVSAADHYVTANELNVEVRFDVITILKNSRIFKIEHLESAFYHF